MESILSFLVVSFFTVATPGPSTLFIVRQGAKSGLPVALASVAGVLMADTFFLIGGAVGVGAALSAAAWLLTGLKLVGAGYFGVLAWRMGQPYLAPTFNWALDTLGQSQTVSMVAAGHGAPATTAVNYAQQTPAGLTSSSLSSSWRQAFMMHVVNVKALLFFAMLVPQFVVATKPLAEQVAGLLGMHLAVAASVLTGYAVAGTALRRTPVGSGTSKVLDILGCVVMAALATGILATLS